MSLPKPVITALNVSQLKTLQTQMTNELLIIKFGADWCGPCKAIAPAYKEFISKAPINILFADIDVDDNLDLYMSLKRAKMVTSIPVFLAFFGGVNRECWFIPDDSVIGADSVAVNNFFQRCVQKAAELVPGGYSYWA